MLYRSLPASVRDGQNGNHYKNPDTPFTSLYLMISWTVFLANYYIYYLYFYAAVELEGATEHS